MLLGLEEGIKVPERTLHVVVGRHFSETENSSIFKNILLEPSFLKLLPIKLYLNILVFLNN